jgi:hypothetical protein
MSGKYYIRNDYVYGPTDSGQFYIRNDYIYGPRNSGRYYIRNGYIYGPNRRFLSGPHAARMVARNLPTSILSWPLSPDSDCADASTCEDAERVS